MEVIVCRVPPRVTFCTEGSTEQDQVLCDRGVDDKHVSHGTSRVVPYPFSLVRGVTLGDDRLGRRVGQERGRREVRVDRETRVGLLERGYEVRENRDRVVAVERDRFLDERVQDRRIKDVPSRLEGT